MKGQLFLPESTYSVDSNMTFDRLLKAFQDHESITGTVTRLYFQEEKLEVDLGGGLIGFMPLDESTIYPIFRKDNNLSPNVYTLVGRTIRARITEIHSTQHIILSRKQNMQDALEFFKECLLYEEEQPVFYAQINNFSRLSTFTDIGAGILGIINPVNFSTCCYRYSEDVGFKPKDIIPVIIIDFDEEHNSFELSRIFKSISDYSLQEGDVVICKVFHKVPNDPTQTGYYVLFNQAVCGIVDSDAKLHYGDTITAVVKDVNNKGVKFALVKKL